MRFTGRSAPLNEQNDIRICFDWIISHRGVQPDIELMGVSVGTVEMRLAWSSVNQITLGRKNVPYARTRAGLLWGTMMANNESDPCDFCSGHVTWRLEEMAFRQSSSKGYVRCQVELSVGTCDRCGSKTLGPDSDAIFEAAFRREYDKLP